MSAGVVRCCVVQDELEEDVVVRVLDCDSISQVLFYTVNILTHFSNATVELSIKDLSTYFIVLVLSFPSPLRQF